MINDQEAYLILEYALLLYILIGVLFNDMTILEKSLRRRFGHSPIIKYRHLPQKPVQRPLTINGNYFGKKWNIFILVSVKRILLNPIIFIQHNNFNS